MRARRALYARLVKTISNAKLRQKDNKLLSFRSQISQAQLWVKIIRCRLDLLKVCSGLSYCPRAMRSKNKGKVR